MTDKIRLNKKKNYIGFGSLEQIEGYGRYNKSFGDVKLVLSELLIKMGEKIDGDEPIEKIKHFITTSFKRKKHNVNRKQYNPLTGMKIIKDDGNRLHNEPGFIEQIDRELSTRFGRIIKTGIKYKSLTEYNKYNYGKNNNKKQIDKLMLELCTIENPTSKKVNDVIAKYTGKKLCDKHIQKLVRKIKKNFPQN